jgi:hypothetical protein
MTDADYTVGIHTASGVAEVETDGDMTDTVPTFADEVALFRVLSVNDAGDTDVEFACTTDDFAYCDRHTETVAERAEAGGELLDA